MTIDLDPERCKIRDAARERVIALFTNGALRQTVDTSYLNGDATSTVDTQQQRLDSSLGNPLNG